MLRVSNRPRQWQPKKAIILLQNELLALRRPCDVQLRFSFHLEQLSKIDEVDLVLESPDLYQIEINGQKISFDDKGWFCDKTFRKCAIRNLLNEGENTVVLTCHFFQQKHVYEILFGKNVHEAELNKLTFDTELESCYLIGNFATDYDGNITYGGRRVIFTDGTFRIMPPKQSIDITDITSDGYWFFAGKMRLRQVTHICKEPDKRYILMFK